MTLGLQTQARSQYDMLHLCSDITARLVLDAWPRSVLITKDCLRFGTPPLGNKVRDHPNAVTKTILTSTDSHRGIYIFQFCSKIRSHIF